MSIWSDIIGRVDSIVDATLSDPVFYRSADRAGFAELQGFFSVEEKGGFVDEPDDLRNREQLKISKALVPEVSRGDRIKRSMASPVTYQPEVSTIVEDGRYWLFNIQRVTDDF